MGKIKRLVINFMFLSAAIFASLIIAEFAVRIGNIGQDTFWQPDKRVGYALIPGKEGFWKTEGLAYVKVNTKGLRDREHAYEKKSDTYRVIILGDSFMEAVQVPFEKSFPALLEEKLNSRSSARHFEIINLSMSNFGTTQEYLYFKNEGIKYNPDLVILAFYINDIANNSYKLQTFLSRPFFKSENGILTLDSQRKFYSDNWLKKMLRKYSRLYAVIQYRKDLLIGRHARIAEQMVIEYKVFSRAYDSEWQEAWEITKNLITALKKEVQNSGAEFYIFTIPAGIQVYDNLDNSQIQGYTKMSSSDLDFQKPDQLLADFSKINEIEYFSLLADFINFVKKQPNNQLYFSYTGHFTPSGHALAAELICLDLVKRGVLN